MKSLRSLRVWRLRKLDHELLQCEISEILKTKPLTLDYTPRLIISQNLKIMDTITIGKLAKSCKVKIDTVRYYEKSGLINPMVRTEAGYRIYNTSAIDRLRFIRKAKNLGFKLEEIKDLLELSEMPEADCSDIRERAKDKIDEIELRIADLNKMKTSLEELVKFCPGEGKKLSECNILKHFYEY